MKRKVIRALVCIVFIIALLYRADYATRDFFLEELEKINMELDKGVEIKTYDVTEEEFFAFLGKRIEEICAENPEVAVSCAVDGKTELAGFARVELENGKHYVYLGGATKVYELSGKMEQLEWNFFLQRVFYWRGLQLEGREMPEDMFNYEIKFLEDGGLYARFYYDFFSYSLTEKRILSYEKDENGFELQLEEKEEDEYIKQDVTLHIVDALPKYETEEELLVYFLKKHPNMISYEVYPLEEEETTSEGSFNFIREENETEFGYFQRAGKYYMASSKKDKESDYYGMVSHIRSQAGYDYREDCIWEKTEVGTEWSNFDKRIFILESDIGTGEKFTFEVRPPANAQPIETEVTGWMEYGMDLEVAVYGEGDSEPFQIFETSSVHYNWQPVMLEDLNADGYLDFSMLWYYGANGGSAYHYIWSPSMHKFIEASEELEYFGSYWVDEEKRRLNIHYHGSAASGENRLFQWENEVDCWLYKSMEYDYAHEDEKEWFEIKTYSKDGTEKVLLDCVVEESYENEDFAWCLYYDDILCEQMVQDKQTGEKYQLYFAQGTMYVDGEAVPEGYDERLYVVSEELYPIKLLEWEGYNACVKMTWTADENGDEKLQISYEDGSTKEFTLEELIGE